MNYTITTVYTNRREYYTLSSLWAANLIAANYCKNADVKKVYIVDNETGEIVTEM